ncbi:MAG: TIGR00268 family protein, partial [Elusimicrobiota bacterium]|nr:TIGR00268 family protein [Elusimicrobiota bacterium]
MDKVDKKYSRLEEIIAESGSLAVAYSGGTDSNFLLNAAFGILGEKLIAVTAQSESYPEEELKEARRLVQKLGVKHVVIQSSELEIDNFSDNPLLRCYYCKGELFREIARVAENFNIKNIADGANCDDRSDFRPGIKAADELGVFHPLMEAKLTKE